jgi:hypothetical protein
MVAKGEAWDDECGYKENKAISAMARASTRLCLTLTERAIESNRNDTFNLLLAEKCFAWEQERKKRHILVDRDWHGDSASCDRIFIQLTYRYH